MFVEDTTRSMPFHRSMPFYRSILVGLSYWPAFLLLIVILLREKEIASVRC